MPQGGDPMQLKQLREARGLSQYRLAKISGVNQAYISRMEIDNKKSAGGQILRKLSAALGCTIEDILGFSGDDHQESSTP